jgi:hypothetical protein
VALAPPYAKYKNVFMSTELLAILIASTVPLAIAVAGFVILGTILRRMGGKMDADDRRRVEEVIREMRETLRNR